MGWRDEGIDEAARNDAVSVADALTGCDVAAVVVSPLRRARETAAPLVDRLGVEPSVDARFGELRVGRWEGLTEDEIARRWPGDWTRWRSDPHALEVAGRESLAALNVRVADALDELAERLVVGAVVVFTHDAVVRAAVAWALGTGPEIYRHVQVDNCSITSVRVENGLRRLVRANDVAHLGRGVREGR
jgi:broad specificity phosphatase PhoE